MSPTVKISIAAWLVVAVGWYAWQRRAPAHLDAIVIADGAVTVRNQTPQEWRSVRIWVNEHYAGGARVIPPGGFVREPLSRFVTARGQTLDAARTSITSVVVLGTTPDGTAVRVVWGKTLLH
ncbi:MAG: hypothetical protein ABIP90_11990 [Vicinamibacterales bacterium]